MFDVTPVTSARTTDCGQTCLKMLLDYYGHDVSLETLIAECGESVAGVSGAVLMRVGRLHGLDPTAWQMSADELILQDRPAIIHWRYTHWCVFCGQNDNGDPVICNPDRGRYHIPKSDFMRLYTGVAIFEGTPSPLGKFGDDYFGEHEPEPDYFNE